ncbi:MAG: 50S ribosomal protein L6 [Christensenellaceae bacterium]|jgi:large subunit ribosomal protein L6|nr:50S ribosomal protein L6 [Christensenellaceae bacterium]
MSRVGKTLIKIPAGVRVEVINSDDKKRAVSVTGPKGVLLQEIRPQITVVISDAQVELKRENDESATKALHGLYNRLIQNMVVGVTEGFTKTLILNGVGYKANMNGQNLVLNLGYSHPCEVKARQGITFKVCNPAEVQNLNLGKDGIGAVIQISGANREQVGAAASDIRDLRKVEPYHMYGIRYSDEHVIRKESKSGKGGKK